MTLRIFRMRACNKNKSMISSILETESVLKLGIPIHRIPVRNCESRCAVFFDIILDTPFMHALAKVAASWSH